MKAAKGCIIVSVDPNQKREIEIGGQAIHTAYRYSDNWREKNPVVCFVVNGLDDIKEGMALVCSYTHFEDNSPFHLRDDLYSIPVDSQIFAWIDDDGRLHPICKNVIVERIMEPSLIKLPNQYQKPCINRGIVAQDGQGFTKGQNIMWLPYSDYEIVYTWKGIEKRACKVELYEICGIFN